MKSRRKILVYVILLIVIDIMIMLMGQNSIPNFIGEGLLPLTVSNAIWCVLFDILIIYTFFNFDNIFKMPYESLVNYHLGWDLSKNDFKVRYVGSYLGIFWAFINPLVTILLYWIVFQFAFNSGDVDGFPFVLWLIAGLVPWFLIQDSITTGTNALIEYSYLVKKVMFKISVLPSIKVISSALVHVMFLVVVLIIYMFMGYYPSPLYMLQLLYYFVCALAFTLAIAYTTSAVVLFVRDLGQFIAVFMQVFMWATPIMWRISIIPENLKWIIKLNPAYYIINGYRDSLLYHVDVFKHLAYTLYFWVVVIVLMIIGTNTFNKLRLHFADIL